MGYEDKQISKRLIKGGAQSANETNTSGLIGYVTEYYPNATSYKGKPLPQEERHTVDIEVANGSRATKYKSVPCFVYSQGIIDKGLEVNDRVWVQFINGDKSQPIVTGFYRDPSGLDLYWNNLKYRISDFFGSLGG